MAGCKIIEDNLNFSGAVPRAVALARRERGRRMLDVPVTVAPEPATKRKFSPEVIVGIIGVVVAIITGVITIAAIKISHDDLVDLKITIAGPVDVSASALTLDGHVVALPKGPLQVQFWTPSVRTKDAASIRDWERVDNEDKIKEFGEQLVKEDIAPGYRRYEVTGYGRGGVQPGMWWVATGNFKFPEFLALYRKIWNPGDDPVYMEITPASRGYGR